LTVLVPRHPQRFAAVAELLHRRGIRYARRSEGGEVPVDTSVLLGDSMGEMLTYCAAVDVVFVGGSLLPLGGQNLLEPIAMGRPTLVGPHMFNFAEATRQALAAGAVEGVADASTLIARVETLLRDTAMRERMSSAGSVFLAAHRGAGQRLW